MIRPLRFPQITQDRAAALLLAIAPLVYFYPAVLGRIVLCQGDGPIQNLPYRVLAANLLLDGHLPLWNPYIFGGMPLLAAMQGGLLFPLNWLFLIFPATVAMNMVVLSTYALAGVGAYLFMRRNGTSIAGAIVTGLVWQWSGFFVAQIGHINIIQTAALLPWVLWAVEGYAKTRRRSGAATVAILVALQAFAGHPQTLVYSLLLVTFYAAYRALKAPADRRPYLLSLLMVVIGLALAAVQIVPTLELMRNSVRARIDYEFFSSFSLPRGFMQTFFAPYLWGGGHGQLFRAPYVGPQYYGEYIGYVGLAALALALLATLLRRDVQAKFWTVTLLVCGALALGRFLPFDLYRLVYHIPLLNLFRVSARHLLEVDFALAVLAGLSVSAIPDLRHKTRTTLLVLGAGLAVAVLTMMAVTLGRPAGFRLGRVGPVSVLRAPELFLPVALAILSAWVLWRFVRGRPRATLFLLAFIVLDLGLWGQTSGWRLSPSPQSDWFRVTPATEFLRQSVDELQPARILTLAQPFDPDNASVGASFDVSARAPLQPDTYMTHRVQNAAGYDGFGLARYSQLADDMKLWGELTHPERSLNEGREFDLLNVRYLVSVQPHEGSILPPLRATRVINSYFFSEKNLDLSPVMVGTRLTFATSPAATQKVALVTSLGWSGEVAQGEVVGRVRLFAEGGRAFEFELRAGLETSEWAHDRLEPLGDVRHRRATVAESWNTESTEGGYSGHNYIATFALPERTTIVGGEVEVVAIERAPELSLTLHGLSLVDETGGVTVPVRKEWFNRKSSKALQPSGEEQGRWRLAAQFSEAVIFENTRRLPRAWLATEAATQPDASSLQVIRTGHFPDGRAWDPLRTALLESTPPINLTNGEAETRVSIVNYEPNRIDLHATSEAAAILVLSENHYPGWRAFVDGHGTETLRVNYNLRGVALTPGEHKVSFIYRPASVLIGLIFSLATGAGLLFWTLWPVTRSRLSRGRSVRAERMPS